MFNVKSNNYTILKRFFRLLKHKLFLIKKFNKEINFYNNLIKNIVKNLNYLINKLVISNNFYKNIMNKLQACINKYNLPISINLKYKKQSFYKLMFNFAKLKLDLINILQKTGTTSIIEIINVFFSNYKNKINKNFANQIEFYDKVFISTGCQLYESTNKNNISFNIKLFNKDTENFSSITLTSKQINNPSCNKISIFTKSFIQRLFGIKLYIPIKNKLLVIFGYFIKNDLNLYDNYPLIKDKLESIKKNLFPIKVNDILKNNYIKQLSLRDLLLFNVNDIITNFNKILDDLKKFKENNISTLVKEFLINDIYKQRYYLIMLILDSKDINSHYIAHLLYDLISIDSSVSYNSDYKMLFNSLHWSIQKNFENSKKKIDKLNNNLTEFNEESIPYEKRIYLMKASKYIKSKALDKLKELNGSKNGETNAKAQQYLDGLLKVPFGIYRDEKINYDLENSYYEIKLINNNILNIITEIEENYSLCDSSLNLICNLRMEIQNINKVNNIHKFENLTNIILKYKNEISNMVIKPNINNLANFKKHLFKLRIKEIRTLSANLNITKDKKKILISKILNISLNKKNLLIIKKYFKLDLNYDNLINLDQLEILENNMNKILKEWKNYNKKQIDYFNEIDQILNKSVYGLKDAKKQIKRIIAQWITGKNSGYVLGFEGPPGTGKTTLAKKGIAQCLKDKNNNSRPFVFIALGGSSNGSTLEGHNYTYVGSTWGRIIDGLINSNCMNPIIYIDELDKVSKTEHGKEIIGILTHLTDPSQNEEFADKYFSGINFDISKCLIIFSYNDYTKIDRILLDRIHRIKINSLSKNEKLIVSKNYLLPELYKNIGITEDKIVWKKSIISYLINKYTYEAGARKLKEKLYEICREINLNYLMGKIKLPFNIDKKFIDDLFFNYPKIEYKIINKNPKIGLINGLFATSAGIGGITIIESYKTYSNNLLELTLTGQQGDVMKESMKCAKTLALNTLPENLIKEIKKLKFGIHVHCPSCSTPKDGPSAGTAITVSIYHY